jgi:hypothetical protein
VWEEISHSLRGGKQMALLRLFWRVSSKRLGFFFVARNFKTVIVERSTG